MLGNGVNNDETETTPCRGRVGLGWAKRRRLLVALVATGALMSSGCTGAGETLTPTPGDVAKPARACLAVDAAAPLAMSPADRRECEAMMSGWYAETWYSRADPPRRIPALTTWGAAALRSGSPCCARWRSAVVRPCSGSSEVLRFARCCCYCAWSRRRGSTRSLNRCRV